MQSDVPMTSYNILLADSRMGNLNALERMFRYEYVIFLAVNVEEASSILERHDIALMLASYSMPGVSDDGFLQEVMRKTPDTICILLIAGVDAVPYIDYARMENIYAYVAEPWETKILKAIVREGIEAHELIRISREPHIRVLLDSALITEEQLTDALRIQKTQEKRLEEILIELGIISTSQLKIAAKIQESEQKRLEEVLVQLGIASHDDIQIAHDVQKNKRRNLTEILTEQGYADEESIYSCYALQLGIPYMQLSRLPDKQNLAEILPLELAYKYTIFPVDREDGVLVVASPEPLSHKAKSEIESGTGYKLMSVCSSHREIEACLRSYYTAVRKVGKRRELPGADTGLQAIMQFQRGGDKIECLIQNITADHTEAIAFTPRPYIRVKEPVWLRIFLWSGKAPVECAGQIVWYTKNKILFRGLRGYLARIIINSISRADERKLDLFMAERKEQKSVNSLNPSVNQ
jgi:DNA-binding NarL/FixJ family response regulator